MGGRGGGRGGRGESVRQLHFLYSAFSLSPLNPTQVQMYLDGYFLFTTFLDLCSLSDAFFWMLYFVLLELEDIDLFNNLLILLYEILPRFVIDIAMSFK